jgi:CBS domain-containing protein
LTAENLSSEREARETTMVERMNNRVDPPIPAADGSVNAVAPDVVVSFLKTTMPFKELDDELLYGLARHCRIDFFPKGTRLFTFNESEVTHLHLIQRGGVRAFITDEDGEAVLKDYRGVGAMVGALGIIRGTKANLNIETVEDTFCFLISREVFLDLVQHSSAVSHYFLKSFSDNVVATAYSELRKNKLTRRGSDDLYLFNVSAGELTKPLFTVPATTSIQEAAATMSHRAIGSLLIYADEDPGSMIGIITDTDLRSKVVAEGRDIREPVSSIMSGPLKTVSASMLCFDVLVKMMTTGIHHLGVEQGSQVIGVVTSHDIMVQQGASPYSLFKDIGGQNDFQGLYLLSEKVSGIVRNIINEGGKAGNISRMIALINQRILSRMLELLHQQLGPPPLKYCWLLFGSEGRSEQVFKTDQDNGLVYEDPADEQQRAEASEYFASFSRQATEHLLQCGYPLCRDGSMASNPLWCKPISAWKKTFANWINNGDPAEQLGSAIFFDFRRGHGTEQPAVDLRDYIIRNCLENQTLAHRLGRDCITRKVPLSFFKNVIVEQNGEHGDRLDIKTRGLLPFVDFARALALKYGIRDTNTLRRLKRLQIKKVVSSELYEAMVDAFELQMQLRVIHQLAQIEESIPPDDFIFPDQLTDLEKRMLKDAFGVIEKMQALLEKEFPEP